jgi:hypothetical protein
VQPTRASQHNSARLQNVRVLFKNKNCAGAEERSTGIRAKPAIKKATARREEPPQLVEADGMRMNNNALCIPGRVVELQLRLCVEAHFHIS